MASITVTDKAWEKIGEWIKKTAAPDQKFGLRLKVMGGGCSGLQYQMVWDVERPGDIKTEKDSSFVVIDQKSFLFLKGLTLDYHETPMHSGFVIQNPNVKHACGCGQSFTT